MDEFGVRYAKWNKPDIEKQRLYNHTNMCNILKIRYNKTYSNRDQNSGYQRLRYRGKEIKKIILMKRENIMVFPRVEGIESRGFIYSFRVSVLQNENLSGEWWWW